VVRKLCIVAGRQRKAGDGDADEPGGWGVGYGSARRMIVYLRIPRNVPLYCKTATRKREATFRLPFPLSSMWDLCWYVVNATTSSSIHPRCPYCHHTLPLPAFQPSEIIWSFQSAILSARDHQPLGGRALESVGVAVSTGPGPGLPTPYNIINANNVYLRYQYLIQYLRHRDRRLCFAKAPPPPIELPPLRPDAVFRLFALSRILSCSLSLSFVLLRTLMETRHSSFPEDDDGR
jgi:hypothetical protein